MKKQTHMSLGGEVQSPRRVSAYLIPLFGSLDHLDHLGPASRNECGDSLIGKLFDSFMLRPYPINVAIKSVLR